MSSASWQDVALKAAAALVAVAAIGYVAWTLSAEDETETWGPAINQRIGSLKMSGSDGDSVIESRQLFKILECIKELAEEKMETLL